MAVHDGQRLEEVVRSVFGTATAFQKDTQVSAYVYNKLRNTANWTPVQRGKLKNLLTKSKVDPKVIDRMTGNSLADFTQAQVIVELSIQVQSQTDLIVALGSRLMSVEKKMATMMGWIEESITKTR